MIKNKKDYKKQINSIFSSTNLESLTDLQKASYISMGLYNIKNQSIENTKLLYKYLYEYKDIFNSNCKFLYNNKKLFVELCLVNNIDEEFIKILYPRLKMYILNCLLYSYKIDKEDLIIKNNIILIINSLSKKEVINHLNELIDIDELNCNSIVDYNKELDLITTSCYSYSINIINTLCDIKNEVSVKTKNKILKILSIIIKTIDNKKITNIIQNILNIGDKIKLNLYSIVA